MKHPGLGRFLKWTNMLYLLMVYFYWFGFLTLGLILIWSIILGAYNLITHN